LSKTLCFKQKNNYEVSYGGFSAAPKFPHASTLNALLTIDRLYDDKAAKAMVVHTLKYMKKGGMYDLIDGGFCRYSVDNMWKVPHFEKMLYDNALLCELYTQAYLTYKEESFLETAKEIADFWQNFMCEDNLFYSASDADGDGEEGTYFVYSYSEVSRALSENGYEHVREMASEIDVTLGGNFEGKNIIHLDGADKPPYFEDVKKILQNIRKNREYPFIDKKIQTSWSAMMIKSLFTLGSIDSKYNKIAIKSLDALMECMYINGTLYHTTLIHKKPKIEAFLEDYAFLAQTQIAAYKFTQNELYLIDAQRFANKALEEFYNKGEWNFSSGEFVTKAETSDNTYTSSVSIMVDVLLSLGTLLEDEKYTHFAFKTLEYNSYELGRKPIYSPYMLVQMLRYLKGDRVIKSNEENFKFNSYGLVGLKYPFIQFKLTGDEKFLLCGEKSCFAATEDVNSLNELIKKLFLIFDGL